MVFLILNFGNATIFVVLAEANKSIITNAVMYYGYLNLMNSSLILIFFWSNKCLVINSVS